MAKASFYQARISLKDKEIFWKSFFLCLFLMHIGQNIFTRRIWTFRQSSRVCNVHVQENSLEDIFFRKDFFSFSLTLSGKLSEFELNFLKRDLNEGHFTCPEKNNEGRKKLKKYSFKTLRFLKKKLPSTFVLTLSRTFSDFQQFLLTCLSQNSFLISRTKCWSQKLFVKKEFNSFLPNFIGRISHFRRKCWIKFLKTAFYVLRGKLWRNLFVKKSKFLLFFGRWAEEFRKLSEKF